MTTNHLTRAQLIGIKQVLSTPALRAQVQPHEVAAFATCLAAMAATGPTALVDLVAQCSDLL